MKEVIVSPKAVEEINEKIELTQDGIAIVADGDTHAAIGDGQFVYVRNHGTLAEGMYRATTAIGENVALTTSNLAVDNAGGLNALKSDVDTLNSNIVKMNANENKTNDILADAINTTGTALFYGSGSSYTGTVPNVNYKYGNFMVITRGMQKCVIAYSEYGAVAINYYDSGAWTGWEELALKSDPPYVKTIVCGAVTNIYITNKSGNQKATFLILTGNTEVIMATVFANGPKITLSCSGTATMSISNDNGRMKITSNEFYYATAQIISMFAFDVSTT